MSCTSSRPVRDLTDRASECRERPAMRPTQRLLAALTVLPLLLVAACSSTDASAGPVTPTPATELRLGYFGNVTHAPALVGVARGLFAAELGDTTLSTQVFNAGPAALEALNAGAIDAAFIGPNPAVNGFIKSSGESLRIIAGATAGGAQLVVRDGITSAADLVGAELATPQLGGTQDVALRSWLTAQGLETSITGGGDVTITPTENAQTLQLFRGGTLDGAWLPEPWASRLVLDAGAHVLVDEKELWPGGKFLTTHLIVAKAFLDAHPQTVEALLRGTVTAVDWLNANPGEAPAVVNAEIAKVAGTPLSAPVIARAFTAITFSVDPLATTLEPLLAAAVAAGTTEKATLDGIYDLRLLNAVLTADGRPTVSAAGLGEE